MINHITVIGINAFNWSAKDIFAFTKMNIKRNAPINPHIINPLNEKTGFPLNL